MTAALPQPGVLFTIASFVLVIALLVTVHEFGHYLVGRWFGVKAETFSLGFGKELAGFTDGRGTRWKLSALPLGGYVKFAGDMNAASMPADTSQLPPEEYARTLNAKPLWQRAAIVAAGPMTNFLFAILVFALLFMGVGRSYTPAVVDAVQPGSAAAAAGLKPGDRVVSFDGVSIARFEDLTRVVALNTGVPIVAEIERGAQRLKVTVTPRVVSDHDGFGNSYKTARLGILGGRETAREHLSPPRAIWVATTETVHMIPTMAEGIWQVIAGQRSFSEMGGPIKVAQYSGQQASLGWQAFVPFIAIISINLGFINLLPIPVLDGGHLAMYAIEGVRRRPLSRRAQELAFMSGFAALFTFMVAKTVNDLGSFTIWHRLAGLIG